MKSFLNPKNGPSLTGIIDVTAHSISLFQEAELPKNINDIFIPNNDISTAEPYDVIIDELGNNVISMYQLVVYRSGVFRAIASPVPKYTTSVSNPF